MHTHEERAIRDLVSRFAIAANLKDFDGFTSTWAKDGVWRIMPPIDATIEGCDTISQGIKDLLGLWAWFVQIPHEGIITFKGDGHAVGRWLMTERAQPAQGDGGHFNHGFYLDDYIKEDGIWKFARREYNYLYLDESAPTGRGIPHSKEEMERLRTYGY